MKKTIILFLVLAFFVSGCVQQDVIKENDKEDDKEVKNIEDNKKTTEDDKWIDEQVKHREGVYALGGYSKTGSVGKCITCYKDDKIEDVCAQIWSEETCKEASYSCCDDSFKEMCSSKNGSIAYSDLHPVYAGSAGDCIIKASDEGKACSAGTECESGSCYISTEEKKNCDLVELKKEGESNQYGNEDFFRATYKCETEKPGKCTLNARGRKNPGGVDYYFKVEDGKLLEIMTGGVIF